jgi:hypothetical protein
MAKRHSVIINGRKKLAQLRRWRFASHFVRLCASTREQVCINSAEAGIFCSFVVGDKIRTNFTSLCSNLALMECQRKIGGTNNTAALDVPFNGYHLMATRSALPK